MHTRSHARTFLFRVLPHSYISLTHSFLPPLPSPSSSSSSTHPCVSFLLFFHHVNFVVRFFPSQRGRATTKQIHTNVWGWSLAGSGRGCKQAHVPKQTLDGEREDNSGGSSIRLIELLFNKYIVEVYIKTTRIKTRTQTRKLAHPSIVC